MVYPLVYPLLIAAGAMASAALVGGCDTRRSCRREASATTEPWGEDDIKTIPIAIFVTGDGNKHDFQSTSAYFSKLNAVFREAHIRFKVVHYTEDTDIPATIDGDTITNVRGDQLLEGALNFVIGTDIYFDHWHYVCGKGKSYDVGGQARARFIVLDDDNPLETFIHEFGHHLGLRHTFFASLNPLTALRDCRRGGDEICDTPLLTSDECAEDNNNFMSYCENRSRFTPQQNAAMYCFASELSVGLDRIDDWDVFEPIVASIRISHQGYLYDYEQEGVSDTEGPFATLDELIATLPDRSCLIFPKGTTEIKEPFSIPENVTLSFLGEDHNTTLILPSMKVEKGGKFTCNGLQLQSGQISVVDEAKLVIEDCVIQGVFINSINSADVKLTNCDLIDGARVQLGPGQNIISGCTFFESTLTLRGWQNEEQWEGDTTIVDTHFDANYSDILFHQHDSLLISKSTFNLKGGAMTIVESSPVFDQCDFTGDDDLGGPGFITMFDSTTEWNNCRLTQSKLRSGDIIRVSGSLATLKLNRTEIRNNVSSENSVVHIKNGATLKFMDTTWENNFPGDLTINNDSPFNIDSTECAYECSYTAPLN